MVNKKSEPKSAQPHGLLYDYYRPCTKCTQNAAVSAFVNCCTGLHNPQNLNKVQSAPMAFRRRRTFKKRGRRAFKTFRRRSGNIATVTETVEVDRDITTVNNVNYNAFALLTGVTGDTTPTFPRAAAVAPQYKWFRAARAEWTYETPWNTYQAAPTATQVPQIFLKMVRDDNQLPGSDLVTVESLGVKPRPFARGNIRFSYKPNTLVGVTNYAQGGTGNYTGRPQFNAWLPTSNSNNATQPQTILYYGHLDYIDAPEFPTTGPSAIKITCRVTWQFKGPWNEQNPQLGQVTSSAAATFTVVRPKQPTKAQAAIAT
uniref:Putative capsid protein n=1 Tax=Dendrocopos leucotos CRESS-DNA-virus sp. TaxID=2815028 RepID=A0A8A4XCX4_9VIRU|nr:MAG: putative capsid protein [Dendrocopos leucotos CRESS-DNA-virus sp.]